MSRVEPAVRDTPRSPDASDQAAVAATAAAARDLEVETATDTGHPAECIVDYAADDDVDAIVMGTSGDEYERNVVGSVSQRVVREAPAPVLTVGPDAEG